MEDGATSALSPSGVSEPVVCYALVTDFPEAFAGRVNHNGLEANVNPSWTFGTGF